MKKQTKQKHELAWCDYCKKMTVFVTHADLPHRWYCTTVGCWNWVLKLKKAPPQMRYI